jgi:tetratricopeptide (TPR) repeat protein
MLIPSAEESYAKGLRALSGGRGKEAMALFEAAIQIAWRGHGSRPQARYLSYYGLCLALMCNENREGLRCCREAVSQEGYDPDIRCNLGRVLLNAGRRAEAYRCFVRGLAQGADHPPILSALRSMGIRGRPTLPFLSRGSPLNVFLGRLRAGGRQPA